MARPRKASLLAATSDLNQKLEILEREMTIQAQAIERLKELGSRRSHPAPRPVTSSRDQRLAR